MATIADIAKEAGVAVGTVSKVLNEGSGVAAAKMKAVERAVEKLDYVHRPKRTGNKLNNVKGVSTGNIAFLSLEMDPRQLYQMAVFSEFLTGIQQTLNKYDLNLTLVHAPDPERVPPILASRQVDGVLLFGGPLAPRMFNTLSRIPTVWCFRSAADRRCQFDHVFYDNSHVGELAADYLLMRGHKNLAFFNIWPNASPFKQRGDRFVAQARAQGARVEIIEPLEEARKKEGKLLAVRKLMPRLKDMTPLPSGIFCPSDDVMATVFNCLLHNGIEPGSEVELIGCNNDPASMEQMHPPPATVDIKLHLVGERAVQQLLWRMAHPDDPSRAEIFIPPAVVAEGKELPEPRSAVDEINKLQEEPSKLVSL